MIEYRQAAKSDLADIKALLVNHDLPASDLSRHLENFVVACDDGRLVGVGGFESCDDFGLVRSFAVSPSFEGKGIAGKIFDIVRENALNQGKSALYLFTTTATGYFEQLGFSACNRVSCPEPIKRTKQFSELCPGSATLMSLAL